MAKRKKIRKKITLARAVQGHLIHCQAADFSQNTINDYQNTFRQLLEYLPGDVLICELSAADVQEFMAFKATETISRCQGITARYANGSGRTRSPKTLSNYHTALCSLWTWAVARGFAAEHIMRQVPAPRVHHKPIQPLSDAEIVSLLRSCRQSRAWREKPLSRSHRPTAERDQAIIALLLETAIRASELVQLRVEDLSFKPGGGQVRVLQGKGGKTRYLPFSRRCAAFLHDWLLMRDDYESRSPLFVNMKRNAGLPMTRQIVARLIKRLGAKAGLQVTPHKLRTTAACLMVKNGMTAWELQRIMGHNDINTTMRYVKTARIDLDAAMANASPLENLRL